MSNQQPRRPMTNQEVEQYLGAQYARTLRDAPSMPDTPDSRGSASADDIQASLQMLGRFNQVALQIKRRTQTLPFFS